MVSDINVEILLDTWLSEIILQCDVTLIILIDNIVMDLLYLDFSGIIRYR